MFANGSWWLRSKKDPRWNRDGRGLVGGFVMSKECEEAIERLKRRFGKPPKDLEVGYMKD